ncbi:MAG: glycosyltransferase family 87 protein [Isosphaeraceae bacterium]
MERNADELLPAANEGRADGERGGRRRTFALTVLILVLILWNLFLVAVTFAGMPRNDFGRPLLGTRAFLDGKDMYGETDAVITWCNSDTILRLWNLNPPHSHLLYLPLAVLPAELALSIWYVVGGLCLYGSIRILLSETGIELTPRRRDWMTAGLLAFSATGVALVTVHMTFLLMLVTTLAWRDARHRRWGKAGAWLGLALSIKPFFLIFIPYLVLKRCWRGLSAMGLTTGLSFLLGLLVFGLESHQSWLRVLSRADTWAWLPLNASLYGAMSRVLMKNTLFTTMATWEPGLVRAAWLALGIPAGLVALLRILPDRSTRGADRAFAILLVSALLLSPLGWIYYFWLPVGPVAAMARGWSIDRSKAVGGVGKPIHSPSWYLFHASMVGMFVPAFFTVTFQPSGLATLLIASLHFWSLLLMWLALVLDRLDLRPTGPRVASVRPVDSPGTWTSPELISGSI